MQGNYSNAEFTVRIGHQAGTLFAQCSGTGTEAALNGATPQVISGATVATLNSLRITITYHDGAYYAYYNVNGTGADIAFNNSPVTKARTKGVLRLYADTQFAGAFAAWKLYVDQIRVYSGFQTVPVELSTFAAE
jgi:hypothetical protein